MAERGIAVIRPAQLARLLGSQRATEGADGAGTGDAAGTAGGAGVARKSGAASGSGPAGGSGFAGGRGRERARHTPAYQALADGIRVLVLEGRVPVGARLPAERELATALAVSRTTVATAFEALRAAGFLESRRGAGSWIAFPAGAPLPARGLGPLPPERAGQLIDLGYASLPAPEPWLTRAVRGATEALPPYALTHGDYPAGLPALRQTIAERYTARGVPTMPEQIMVTTGAMGATDAIISLFAPRGERVAVESPSYANILQLLRDAGARLVPVAMAEGTGGWDVARWRQVLREAVPRLAYVVADFHNPTGALADEESRRALTTAARAAGTVLLVDETMAELRLDADLDAPSAMPRPVCAFDPAGSTVITVGSASKAFWAGLRVGWVRAAPETIRRLVAARAYADLGTPVLEQLALNWLLTTGGWEEAVALRRAQAAANRAALVAAIRARLPDWEFTVPRGGLTLWVRAGGLSGSRIAAAGEEAGVRVPSGPRFGVDGAFEGYLRLPFTVAGSLAEEAADRLAHATALVRAGAGAHTAAQRGLIA